MDRFDRKQVFLDYYHRPVTCEQCKGIMIYKGLGEYRCEDCGFSEYDDYGKVRNYLEHHKGANVTTIAEETEVTSKSIRNMIKESRFEVVEDRVGYIVCETCGINIKSGRLCEKCEILYHRKLEAEARAEKKNSSFGVGMGTKGESGSKRFNRD